MQEVVFYNLLGYPNIDKFKKIIKLLDDKNIRFFEIGIPSHDPNKDGEDIAQLHPKALTNISKSDLEQLLFWIKENTSIKVILMTYYDGFLHYQLDLLDESLYDAILCVNNDLKDYPNLKKVKFYTPSMDIEEMKNNLKDNVAFCYVNSGITKTGGKLEKNQAFEETLKFLRQNTDLPLFVGFGIKDKKDKESVLKSGADGIIIGSEFIRKISKDTKNLSVVKEYVDSLED